MAAQGKPWIWRTEFFGHEPQADLALLAKGFHVAYIDVQNLYGAPIALDAMDAMYQHVTSKFKLSSKVVLEGFSRAIPEALLAQQPTLRSTAIPHQR